jgi:hypothetical protein
MVRHIGKSPSESQTGCVVKVGRCPRVIWFRQAKFVSLHSLLNGVLGDVGRCPPLSWVWVPSIQMSVLREYHRHYMA